MRFETGLPPALALAAVLAFFPVTAHGASPVPIGPRPAPPDSTGKPQGEEAYQLTADRLEGSAGAGENIYTATRVKVVHGRTTVTGDSALVFREREFVRILGNVRIVDGTTRMSGDEATYDRKTRTATLRGNVRIDESGSQITGEQAVFYRTEDRSVITGHPTLRDSTRIVKADRIEYNRATEIATATGHVDAFDSAESTRVLANRVRYDRRADYAWADSEPVLQLTEHDGKMTEVKGLAIEFDNSRRAVFAIGDVRIARGDLRADCDRAEFFQNENRAVLLGSPRAWDPRGVARGDTMVILFSDHRVDRIVMHPHGSVTYEAKADSGRGERNVAHGDSITIHFAEEEARVATIVGHAESSYWPSSADSAAGGRNVSTGDTITVTFTDGKPSRATVRGKSSGIYYMAAEGDTAAAAKREVVNYRGVEIVYDVDQSTVDVLGEADVRYKEMQLEAGRVNFNSRTERMRAEDGPVLYDGKDKIVGTTMTYDLQSRRGTVYDGRTNYDRGYIYGRQVRRVSENVLDVKHGSYSTCELAEPHYHFESAKMKVKLLDKVVARPVVLYIEKVPVFALPFYVFPIKPGRHSGFELPQLEFGSADGGGKFIRNVGYYWAINDFLDATAWADWYQGSSWVAHGQFRYNKRYGYQGQVSGSYEDQFGTASNRWDFFLRHFQTLNRNTTLTAQANLTNSSSYLRDQNLGHSVLIRVQRLLVSSVSVQRGWSGGSFSFGLLQNQNLYPTPGTIEKQWQVPSVTYALNPRPIGHPAKGETPARLPWLATTTYSFRATALYQSNLYNEVEPESTVVGTDSIGAPIYQVSLLDTTDARGAARYDISLSDVRQLLGFLRVSPALSFNGIYYSRDATGARNQVAGIWRAALGANSALFGTFRTSLGPLRAIRHVITPAISFVFQPANTNFLYQNSLGVTQNRFVGVSGITLAGQEARFLTYSLRNDLHIKWGDPAQPKVINNLIQMNTSGTYNILAARSGARPLSDVATSLHIQPITRSGFDFSFLNNPYDDFKILAFTASTGIAFSGQTQYQDGAPQGEIDPGADAMLQQSPLVPSPSTASGLPWQLGLSLLHGQARAALLGDAVHPLDLGRRRQRVLFQDQREEPAGALLRAGLARAPRIRRLRPPADPLGKTASSCGIRIDTPGGRT